MTVALVVGCASCVWDDVRAARKLVMPDAIYCVKLIGVHWPHKFQAWVTLHPEKMDDYEAQRRALGLPDGYEIVAPMEGELGEHGKKGNISRRVSYRWPGMNSSASSGIYGAKVALEDGHDKVILAGIPMDNTPHFSRGHHWAQVGAFLPGFEKSVSNLRPWVRSMSGYTHKVFGGPSAEWLGISR